MKHKKRQSAFIRLIWILLVVLLLVSSGFYIYKNTRFFTGGGTAVSSASTETQAGNGSFSSAAKPDAPSSSASGPSPAGDLSLPSAFDLSSVPAYDGSPWVTVNGNIPFFTEDDLTTESFEEYGALDSLGRCTCAFACAGRDLMPAGARESITEIRPSGWQFAKYDGIEGNYLYNRCHLLAYGLTGENANERNLITGTRYLNSEGMNSFENDTIAYIRNTGHHVLYRVTPIFEEKNLVASGVLMEGLSVEDHAIRFCIYAYNVQPGITINYATGASSGPAFTGTKPAVTASPSPEAAEHSSFVFREPAEDVTYVVNTRSGKFHRPGCEAVREIHKRNRWDSTDSREELIRAGYTPCNACRP